ncbi:Histidinol dehydrogenase [uncultured archaeon]|nr:Histidinol dehydrogenase [uncultured archaeon]
MLYKKISELTQEDMEQIMLREVEFFKVMDDVSVIINEVKKEGDDALKKFTKEFDGADIVNIEVEDIEIENAYEEVEPELIEALENAAANIAAYHGSQVEAGLSLTEVEPGLTLGYKVTPIASVGVYVPGGTAAYPSTALMTIIPAKVAGVMEVIACTPPNKDGKINPLTLVAADMAGADRIFKVGGAQAIAAMAFGTETIPSVDKIVGPGSVYVTAAKMLVRNTVEIDFPAGPSEVVVLADESQEAGWIAADMIAQVEHDPKATAILITTSSQLAKEVKKELEIQSKILPRRDIIEKSLEHAAILIANHLDESIVTSNKLAPEHLEIMVADPLSVLEKIQHAGSISVGKYAPAAAGDYASGTNHVLPTGGYARMVSALNVDHFIKKSCVQIINEFGLKNLKDTIVKLAEVEGFQGHVASIEKRFR